MAAAVALPSSAFASSAGSDNTTGSPVGSPSPFNIRVGPDGWIYYTADPAKKSAYAADGSLAAAQTVSTIQGKATAAGDCSFTGSLTPTTAAGAYAVEVGYNPRTCQQQIAVGVGQSADVVNGVNVLPSTGIVTGSSSVSALVPAAKVPARSYTAAAVAYQSGYTKTRWIDPINVTITSLTANLKWPVGNAGGTISSRGNPYAFKYDGWRSTGLNAVSYPALAGGKGWSYTATDKFTNKDFATIIYEFFGAPGWAACGFKLTVTAHFNHSDTVSGIRAGAGAVTGAWNDTKDGACSNLVHHAADVNYGWTS